MKSSSKVAALLALLAVPALAAKVVEGTVAVVNGKPILLSEYQKEVATAIDFWGKSQPGSMDDPSNVRKLRESTLEQLIDRELLVQEGEKLKLKVREREVENAVEEIRGRFRRDENGRALAESEAETAFQAQLKAEGLDYARFRDRLSRQILARKVIDEQVMARVEPPPEPEVKAYFEKVAAFIASKSTRPPAGMDMDEAQAFLEVAGQVKALSSERVRVSRILVRVGPGATETEKKRAKRAADEIKKKLDGGADFAALAREESEDPDSAARGGDIGYVLRGVAPPELEKAVFSLGVGETSAPILTDIGWNIVRVNEKRAADAPQYDRFKDEIAQFLTSVKRHRALERFVKGLRDKATIERSLPSVP